MEEVLDYVLWEIRRSGYERKLIGGVVLTGGGALMAHAEQLTELHTGMSCRIGVPVEHLAHGYQERVSSPIFSTAIGLLLRGLQDVDINACPGTRAGHQPDGRRPRTLQRIGRKRAVVVRERLPQNQGMV